MNSTSLGILKIMSQDIDHPYEVKARLADADDLMSLVKLEKGSGAEDIWSQEDLTLILKDRKIKVVIVDVAFQPTPEELKKNFHGAKESVAYIAFEIKKREVVIWSIVITPPLRRHGIGLGLINWIKKANQESFNNLKLTCIVRESDLTAQLFLKACAFHCSGAKEDIFECPPEAGMTFQYNQNKT